MGKEKKRENFRYWKCKSKKRSDEKKKGVMVAVICKIMKRLSVCGWAGGCTLVCVCVCVWLLIKCGFVVVGFFLRGCLC